jgi:large subunit ribosomal protein L3e
MSHRKFEHPRQCSLAYLPKRRTKHHRGRVRHWPKDDKSKPVHLTAFCGYKAGMTHCVKYQERREGKKIIKKDVVHATSVIECPPMKIIGMVGYIETPRGLRTLSTVWAQQIDQNVKRRFYKNWYAAKKNAFKQYVDRFKHDDKDPKSIKRDLERIKKYCTTVRVITATQVDKLNLRQLKAHVMEIQINGGKDVAAKVDWAYGKFEQEVRVSEVFEQSECIDTVGVTRGKGTQGVIKRFRVSRLQRCSHRGIRKVACIGAWHPSAVKWTVARRGQLGYHSRTQLNNKIYRIGAGSVGGATNNAYCEADAVEKNITPLGGFPHYGEVNEDFVLIKGGVMGTRKRPVVLRKSIFATTRSWMTEKIDVKFIDTSSKIGHGRFQTAEEKDKVLGPLASKQRNKDD